MSKKFYMYEKTECTPYEYVQRRKELLKFKREDLAKEHKRHDKKVAQILKEIADTEADIAEAETYIVPELPELPEFLS